jgi:hypothetical protein
MPTPIPCYAGTYSSVTGATECIVTPINYYTRANASQAVACPAGTHTQESGSTSPRDCLPNSNQTANIKSLPAGLKFNQAIVVNKQSSAGLALAVSVRGNCSVVNASASTWRIVAGKAKGTCMVLIANSGGQGVNPFSLSRTLKISKNGK